MARKFTADQITPNAAKWDEDKHFPRDVVRQAGELGFGAIYISEEMGGIALGRLESALIFEALSYGCPSTAAFISVHNMASWMIDKFGGGEIKQRYLPQLGPLGPKAIHAPWLAKPMELTAADIVLGRDYPMPIVDHATARAQTMLRYAVVKKQLQA